MWVACNNKPCQRAHKYDWMNLTSSDVVVAAAPAAASEDDNRSQVLETVGMSQIVS